METSSPDPSVDRPTVKLTRHGNSFELSDISREFGDIRSSTLEEFLSYAYKDFKNELETNLREKDSFKVTIYLAGVFTEIRDVWYNEWCEVEQYLDHTSGIKYINFFSDIEDCYNSFTEEYKEIVSNHPAEWDYHSAILCIEILGYDIEGDLD